jgi:hypothetical protein
MVTPRRSWRRRRTGAARKDVAGRQRLHVERNGSRVTPPDEDVKSPFEIPVDRYDLTAESQGHRPVPETGYCVCPPDKIVDAMLWSITCVAASVGSVLGPEIVTGPGRAGYAGGTPELGRTHTMLHWVPSGCTFVQGVDVNAIFRASCLSCNIPVSPFNPLNKRPLQK